MKYLKLLGWLIVPSLVAIFVFVIPSALKIKNIECKSQYGPCSEALDARLSSFQGKSLREVKKSLKLTLGSEPAVGSYAFQLKLPATLLVNIIEDKAIFALSGSDKKHFWLVDKDGQVIRIEGNTNLPLVVLPVSPPNVGEKVSSKSLFALEIISNLYSLHQIRQGSLVGDWLEAYLPTGEKVIFPLEGDREALIGSLELIISRLNQVSKDSNIKVSVIDLRFKNPVLK